MRVFFGTKNTRMAVFSPQREISVKAQWLSEPEKKMKMG